MFSSHNFKIFLWKLGFFFDFFDATKKHEESTKKHEEFLKKHEKTQRVSKKPRENHEKTREIHKEFVSRPEIWRIEIALFEKFGELK